MAATEGRVRFHARVAGRVLAIVERELAAGDGPARAHAARLAALGFASDAELAAAIRTGALDDRWDEVTAAVRATVAAKLAVANPTYAADRDLTADRLRPCLAGPRPRAPGDGGPGTRASQGVATILRFVSLSGPASAGPGGRPEESVAMTLAVTVVCQDGVVVAADSRTTLGNHRMLRVGSDFTHKVFESGGVAVATYGEAFVDDRSIASHMAEFAVVEAGNCDHPGPDRPQAGRLLRRPLRRPVRGRRGPRGRTCPAARRGHPRLPGLGLRRRRRGRGVGGHAARPGGRARSPPPPTAAGRPGAASPTWSPAWCAGADLELLVRLAAVNEHAATRSTR